MISRSGFSMMREYAADAYWCGSGAPDPKRRQAQGSWAQAQDKNIDMCQHASTLVVVYKSWLADWPSRACLNIPSQPLTKTSTCLLSMPIAKSEVLMASPSASSVAVDGVGYGVTCGCSQRDIEIAYQGTTAQVASKTSHDMRYTRERVSVERAIPTKAVQSMEGRVSVERSIQKWLKKWLRQNCPMMHKETSCEAQMATAELSKYTRRS